MEATEGQFAAVVQEECPGILDNPYLAGHWPSPKQMAFLTSHRHLHKSPKEPYEALYGGAAGGGKSDALLMGAAQTAWLYPGSASVIIRRTYAELAKPGALMNRALQWWLPAGVRWNSQEKIFVFPNGSQVQFGYHSHPRDDHSFQGGAYQYVAFDELTHWPDIQAYGWLKTRMRRLADSSCPMRILSASNPGGPGHAWVKMRFMGGVDPDTCLDVPPEHPYFPATVEDNEHIDRESYIANLQNAFSPEWVARLLHGDWDAVKPSDYFRAEWFGALLNPEADLWPKADCIRIRWWDLAASEDKANARTAGVRMARHRSGVRAVEHAIAFWKTPGDRDTRIVQEALADGPGVIQGFEVEGGSGGLAQVLALEKRLRSQGIRVAYQRPKAEMTSSEAKFVVANPRHDIGKQARAVPVSSCLRRGAERRGEGERTEAPWWAVDADRTPNEERDGLRLFSGPWVSDYLTEMEIFYTKDARCDLVDATSGAWAWLEAHPFGLRTPMTRKEQQARVQQQDVHPAERVPVTAGAKDRAGRWRP